MTIQKIGRLLIRRGLRGDLPTDLLDGQLAFATDTGELFVGAPNAPNPAASTARVDGNIRWATEADPFAQPNTFNSINLDPGPNTVVMFPTGHDFLILDYGLAYRDAGPYFTGSLKIYDTSINHAPSSDNSVTFAVQKVGQVRTLTANNNSSTREINLTYQVRSWSDGLQGNSVVSISGALQATIKKLTAATSIRQLIHATSSAPLARITAAIVVTASSGSGWTDVELPDPGGFAQINAMSSNTNALAVGQYSDSNGNTTGCYWNHSGVFAALSGTTAAEAITPDGNVIAGEYQADPVGGGDDVPFVYNQGTNTMAYLALPAGCHSCHIYDISDDGTVVVGSSVRSGTLVAVAWQNGSVIELGLGSIGTADSEALAISADGTKVAGFINDSARDHPVYWTLSTNTPHDIGATSSDGAKATGISRDGSIIVGSSFYASDPNITYRAFKWTAPTGSLELPVINPLYDTYAEGLSSDGAVTVGYAMDSDGRHAAAWTSPTNPPSVAIASNGDPTAWTDFYGAEPNAAYAYGYENNVAAFYWFGNGQPIRATLAATLHRIAASVTTRQPAAAVISGTLNKLTGSFVVASDADVMQNIASIDQFLFTVTQP